MNSIKLIFFLSLILTSQQINAAGVAESAEDKISLADQLAETRQKHFQNIDELVALKVPGLAFKYLQSEQPEYNKEDPVNWLFWEQKRIVLLKYMRQWQVLNKRVTQQTENLLSSKVATADRNWFLTEQLRALVELKQYSLALDKTRQLIWNASSLVRSATLAAWRRIIIQIYLNQGEIRDAQTAMRRYQQDYGELQNEDGFSWLQLQAELLIQLGQYREAIEILMHVKTAEAEALMTLAKLKAKIISADDASSIAQKAISAQQQENGYSFLFHYVSLVAAMQAANIDQSIETMERLLSEDELPFSDSLIQIGMIQIDADTLWDLYLQKGQQIANAKGLLKGNDAEWYALASNYFQNRALTAKSLFAVLSLQAKELQHRQLAMKQLVKLIQMNDQSLQLVNRLFTGSSYFESVEAVPPEVRYSLIDYHLSHADVKAAASLMANLKQPPEDQPQFDWNLRRARVLILSGSFEQGTKVLHEMLSVEKLEPAQADKFLQVVFDLQSVEQYQYSLELFNQLQELIDDERLVREITFWKAESFYGLKQYDKAAYLFLKSAVSPEKAFDPWYHTATFRASESLLEAGLYEDARLRFMHLLRITENAARKAVIRQRLQSIQLKKQVE